MLLVEPPPGVCQFCVSAITCALKASLILHCSVESLKKIPIGGPPERIVKYAQQIENNAFETAQSRVCQISWNLIILDANS
ncbi:hypothetical protein V1519DRAFT_452900 [Lipomyces tetrasporus]